MKTPLNPFLALVVLLSVVGGICHGQSDTRPNILLIVADDLGYADLGCYGGDIDTPNIDSLAAEGLRFSRFYVSPVCATTRAMLLSGNDNHIAGMGRQARRTNEFGYEGRLTDRVVAIPQVLRDAGYHTYMAGKWHLGDSGKLNAEENPHAKGFEHSFINLGGGGNHYNNRSLSQSHDKTLYSEDGQLVDWPEGAYSTDLFTEKLITFIDRHEGDGKPFFAFAAYTSPHWPLQVDEEYWRKYEGRYDEGYEALRVKRLASLKKAGMVRGDAVLPPVSPRVKSWDSLTPQERKMEARKMELYAGMVDNLDHNIGRLTRHLKQTGKFENTLIVFMSDNGAAAEDWYYGRNTKDFVQKHYNHDYDRMGKPDTFVSYGPQWAEAGSAPFTLFKGFPTEGGMIAPMIITGPGVSRKGGIHHNLVTLMDLAPTFYEVARTRYPTRYKGRPVYPMKGASIMPVASGSVNSVHDSDYVFALECGERAMIRKGDWKLLSIARPFSRDNFALFNVADDIAEVRNLKASHPEKFHELLTEWDRFAEEIRVQFPSPRANVVQ